MTAEPSKACFVNNYQIQIGYHEWGQPNGQPIVLIHGMAETSEFFWNHLVERFAGTHRIIAFDLLGHGNSSHPNSGDSPTRQIELYHEAMEQLNISYPILIGHSLGGIIATQFAITHPQQLKALVLYDTPIPCGFFGNTRLLSDVHPFVPLSLMPLLIPGLAEQLDFLIPDWLRQYLIAHVLWAWKAPYNIKDMTSEFRKQAIRNTHVALRQGLVEWFLFFNLEKKLPQVSLPTFLLVGESDRLLSVHRAQVIASMLPDCELEVVPAAGHVALLDNPHYFLHHLQDFLGRV